LAIQTRLIMESRIESSAATEPNRFSTEKLVDELKAVLERAEQKAVERAKAADRLVRDHPYQTIGLAFGIGLLIGFLASRR
jgi:ElaB/YqjD/DUF883 family membrane-anchored ribosome-binding protein